jgi:hypothetical protein
MDSDMDEVHERLQYARSQAGFDEASEAARYYGWNENTYRSHENGQRGFRKDKADRYAKAFKVSVEWLYYGRGPRELESASSLADKINRLSPVLQKAVEAFVDSLPQEQGRGASSKS